MNNYQPVDLTYNQIIQCIICHNEIVHPEILDLCIRCHKRFITSHKSNDIIVMKKHADTKHGALLKMYVEKLDNRPRPSFESVTQPLNAFMLPQSQFLDLFPLQTNFKKTLRFKLLPRRCNVVCDKKFFAH